MTRIFADARSGGLQTATLTKVASAIVDTALTALNTSRQGGVIYNDSTAILYVLYGSGTASSTNYTVQVPSQGTHTILADYVGPIRGIWATANGNAYVTELS